VDNRRLLMAVLLSMIVIIGWQFLFPPPEPTAPPVPPASSPETELADSETGEAGDAPAGRAEPGFAESRAESRDAAAPAGESGAQGAPPPPAVPERSIAEREESVFLEGEGFRAELSNRGGQLVSLELPGHDDGAGGRVDLVRDRRGVAYPFGLVTEEGAPLPVDDALFVTEPGGNGSSVVFRYAGPASGGGEVVKRFAVDRRGLLSVSIEAELDDPWAVSLGPGLRNPSAIDEERKLKYRGVVYRSGEDDIETLESEKTEAVRELPGGGLDWIGIEDTYFLSVVVPTTRLDSARINPWLVVPGPEGGASTFVPMPEGGPNGDEEDLRRELQLVLVPRGDSFEATAYLGAKQLERLEALPWGLEETVRLKMMGLGFIAWIARFFLTALEWTYLNVVPNYGWAIVLLTIAIKLVLLPLTHKSYVSMQKMQELAPRIKGIRAKYKGKLKDKKGRPDIEQQRKMNEEVAALYRAEKVNPAGGCLPMLLQFPVLIGFYSLLYHAIELRGAPWVLWIDDLSMHDPIYVLPIVMGATQFLQQKMAPSGGDAMQRKMMLAMPVVFTFLFMGFPSGLVLYWLTNNVLTLVQQLVYQRIKARREAEPGVAA
jgi:YidC/Oxa1 family membrane protein insertase